MGSDYVCKCAFTVISFCVGSSVVRVRCVPSFRGLCILRWRERCFEALSLAFFSVLFWPRSPWATHGKSTTLLGKGRRNSLFCTPLLRSHEVLDYFVEKAFQALTGERREAFTCPHSLLGHKRLNRSGEWVRLEGRASSHAFPRGDVDKLLQGKKRRGKWCIALSLSEK